MNKTFIASVGFVCDITSGRWESAAVNSRAEGDEIGIDDEAEFVDEVYASEVEKTHISKSAALPLLLPPLTRNFLTPVLSIRVSR